MAHTEAVKHFYDQNTAKFLRWGKHQQTYNIHQALWADGVKNLDEAVSYSNQLILGEIETTFSRSPQEPIKVLDLGCGVGSSAIYLAQHLQHQAKIWGITISPAQVALAKAFQKQQTSLDNCQFLEGDFLDWPEEIPEIDVAFAIEAFLHAASPERFFQAASQGIRAGGKLILVDDFLSPRAEGGKLSKKQHQRLSAFKHGWMAGSLLSVERADQIAQGLGFQLVTTQNLTPYMRLGRPRDKAIGLMSFFAGKWMQQSTYFKMMHGGYAKQQCLKQDLLHYQKLVWERK